MRVNRLNQLIDQRTTVKGVWGLDRQNEVTYRVSEDGREQVYLRASLIAAEPNALVLGVTQRKTNSRVETSLLKLSGVWSADDKNQLVFEVRKEFGRRDILTLKGGWEINKDNEIVYTWEKIRLKTKTKEIQELVIRGSWDITEKNRLTYYAGGDSANALKFRGTLQTPGLLAKKGEIRYQLGMEIRGRTKLKTLVFFGTWKFSRTLEISFELTSSEGRRAKIVFGGAVLMRPDRKLEVLLTAQNGEPLGIELVLTRSFFDGNARLFARLQRKAEESAVEAGMALNW